MAHLDGLMTCKSFCLVSTTYYHYAYTSRPHDGWLDLAKPFIAAFHAGATSVDSYITSDQLIYWYRPQPRLMDCDATDNCEVSANNASGNYFLGRPNGWEDMQDAVFVVSLLQSAGTVQVASGPNTGTFNAPAGASAFQVPMGFGPQSFSLSRNGNTVLSGTSLKDIIDGCVCGIYNFNAYGKTPCLVYLAGPLLNLGISWHSPGRFLGSAQATFAQCL
jgi:hypothetical protein